MAVLLLIGISMDLVRAESQYRSQPHERYQNSQQQQQQQQQRMEPNLTDADYPSYYECVGIVHTQYIFNKPLYLNFCIVQNHFPPSWILDRRNGYAKLHTTDQCIHFPYTTIVSNTHRVCEFDANHPLNDLSWWSRKRDYTPLQLTCQCQWILNLCFCVRSLFVLLFVAFRCFRLLTLRIEN